MIYVRNDVRPYPRELAKALAEYPAIKIDPNRLKCVLAGYHGGGGSDRTSEWVWVVQLVTGQYYFVEVYRPQGSEYESGSISLSSPFDAIPLCFTPQAKTSLRSQLTELFPSSLQTAPHAANKDLSQHDLIPKPATRQQ